MPKPNPNPNPNRGVHRRWVQPLLAELCSGLSDEDLPAALAGLLADSALVRSAALAALPLQPSLEAGECPADDAVTALLWLAQHDPLTGALGLWCQQDSLNRASTFHPMRKLPPPKMLRVCILLQMFSACAWLC